MPEANLEFDIVIVGAGIAGSALACTLQETDYRIALVEAQPLRGAEPIDEGLSGFDARVSAITPASQRLFESMGVWQGIVAQRACPYQHMSVWDGEGTGRIEFDAGEVGAPVLGHIIENRVITGALAESIQTAGRVSLFNPARVADLSWQDEQGMLELEDGRVLRAGLLVAADGALSRMRELGEFRTREWDYDQHALVCTVATEKPHQQTAYQRFISSGPLAFLPLPDSDSQHHCSIVWSLDSDQVDAIKGLDDEAFCNELGQAFEHVLGRVLAASPRFAFPLSQRHAVDYVRTGLALVGDAAHTIHPLAGQGINLGLQDVAVLSEELQAALACGEAPGNLDLLRRYQRQRKGDNLLMMSAMEGFKRLFGEQALPLRVLRGIGMQLADRAGPVKQELMRRAMGLS